MKVRQAFTTLLFVLTNKPEAEAKARAAEKATQKPPKMRASATSEAKLPTPDTVPTKSSAATSSNKRKREDARTEDKTEVANAVANRDFFQLFSFSFGQPACALMHAIPRRSEPWVVICVKW